MKRKPQETMPLVDFDDCWIVVESSVFNRV